MDKLEEEFARAIEGVIWPLADWDGERSVAGTAALAGAQACAVIARKQEEAMQLAMDEALHWLARGDIGEADRILRAALHRKGVEPKCCDGGPQWGHAWDCPKCPE